MQTDPASETLHFLFFRILADGQSPKPSNSECYTSLSEPFRIYQMSFCQIGNALQCSQVSELLLQEFGHYMQAINYPTVPVGQEKLRLAPTPHHTKRMMDKLVTDMLEIWTRLDLPLYT
jgi:7-keto-8-aminopelargonate synthetase-like enzyme